MKKLLTKFIALPLALIAAFSCAALAACGNNEETVDPGNNITPVDPGNDDKTPTTPGNDDQTPSTPGKDDETPTTPDNDDQMPSTPDEDDEDDEDEEEEEAWPLADGEWVEKEYITAAESADGAAHSYAVFVPASYDGNTALPLLAFMGDATATTKPVQEIYSKEMACVVASSAAVQAIQACFVVAIDFPGGTGNGGSGMYENYYDYDWGEAEWTVTIVNQICEDYNVNTNKMYLTGQSAGCMAEFEINYRYPNMFAATYYVAGHWAFERVHNTLFQQTWLFTASQNAATEDMYQATLKDALEEDGLDYSTVLVSAKAKAAEESNEAIREMLAEGNTHNFIQIEAGTLTGVYGTGYLPSAHNQTWRAEPGAYTFLAVYEWLFQQELDPDNPIETEYSAEYDAEQQAIYDAEHGQSKEDAE